MTALPLLALAAACLDPAAAVDALHERTLPKLAGMSKPVAQSAAEGYALVWPDASRALVLLLPGPVLATRNIAVCAADSRLREDRFGAVRVLQLAEAPLAVSELKEIDTAGVRIGSRVVLFPAGDDHPPTVSLYLEGGTTLQYLLTGMAGGTWEIWRDGFLVDPGLPAEPGGTLSFEGPPGSYFIRKR